MLIDSHCHLDAPEFVADRDAVVARARAAGVGQIVVPAITAATLPDTLAMRERYGCWLALGLHPIYLTEHRPEHLDLLRATVLQQRPQAIGEIGLDFFLPQLDVNRQLELLRAQLRLARDVELPVLLHVRKAQDVLLRELRRFGVRQGIAHAFNGSLQQAEAYLAQGLKLGFGGNLTFARAQNIRRLAAELPLDGIVLETDAPDISPDWAYGQRNEPAHLAGIAAVLAELRGLTPAAVAAATTRNVRAALNLSEAD